MTFLLSLLIPTLSVDAKTIVKRYDFNLSTGTNNIFNRKQLREEIDFQKLYKMSNYSVSFRTEAFHCFITTPPCAAVKFREFDDDIVHHDAK